MLIECKCGQKYDAEKCPGCGHEIDARLIALVESLEPEQLDKLMAVIESAKKYLVNKTEI